MVMYGSYLGLEEAGAKLAGINWLHDTSPEALEGSGGATAAFHFESDS